MKLVRQGHSWSGGERNRFFLNRGAGSFSEMSGLSGLDHPDDGRALALVDWDQDGDLDLWYRNRTAPRLRIMLNQQTENESISLRLQGVTANRDGIGAVVELLGAQQGQRLVRSVRAGDLFLSQSSKWLHFGMGPKSDVTGAEVLWPGGERERFSGLVRGGRFLLKQGTGVAISLNKERAIKLKEEELVAQQDSGSARILLPARLPIPMAQISYRDIAARSSLLQKDGLPKLIVLWSADCPHCQGELRKLQKAQRGFEKAGIKVIGLSVDGIEGPAADISRAYSMMDQLVWPYDWGFIDLPSVQGIHHLQEKLFDRTPASSVPLAFLVDGNFNVGAIYRGTLETEHILKDWASIQHTDDQQLFHLAPPLSGTWFTNPLKREEVIRLFGN